MAGLHHPGRSRARGKGGTQYLYSADVMAALCNGAVLAIGDVWSGQSWLSNARTLESYVIAGGSPSYTPANAADFAADGGVYEDQTYSSTNTDLVDGSPLTLTGSHG